MCGDQVVATQGDVGLDTFDNRQWLNAKNLSASGSVRPDICKSTCSRYIRAIGIDERDINASGLKRLRQYGTHSCTACERYRRGRLTSEEDLSSELKAGAGKRDLYATSESG